MKITIYDIAEKAGVSAATVSNVINDRGRVGEKTRKKVLEIMKELQYHPNVAASVLKGKAAYTIGFFIPDMLNPVYMEYAKYAEERAQQHGFSIVMCSTENNLEKEQYQIKALQQKNVDGFIITSKFQNQQLLRELESEGYPVICLAHIRPEYAFDAVSGNDTAAGKMAAGHLIQRGHKHIALLAEKHSLSSIGRIKGFQEAVEKTNDPSIRFEIHYADDTSIDCAEKAAFAILEKPNRPSAFFGGNDVLAVGIMQAARNMGLTVPDQLAVIGLDDTFLCKITSPPLTAISMPIQQISEKAVDILVEKIQNSDRPPVVYTYEPELINRKST